jgi:hypothetical protein
MHRFRPFFPFLYENRRCEPISAKKITKIGLFLMQNAPFSADDNPVIFFEPKALFVKKKKRKKADFFADFLPFFTIKNPF